MGQARPVTDCVLPQILFQPQLGLRTCYQVDVPIPPLEVLPDYRRWPFQMPYLLFLRVLDRVTLIDSHNLPYRRFLSYPKDPPATPCHPLLPSDFFSLSRPSHPSSPCADLSHTWLFHLTILSPPSSKRIHPNSFCCESIWSWPFSWLKGLLLLV